MPNAAFLFEIILASVAITSVSSSFPHCISCPCGSSNKNYTHCTEDTTPEKLFCERWSNCHTCKANVTFCLTCPPGRFGSSCSKTSDKHIRRKRQDNRNFLNYPRQSGSCPFIERPDSGSIRCTQTGNDRSCTARCLPGYHFEGEENVNEITLRCSGSVWVPRRRFPQCKSGGHCEVRVTGAGYYNCTIDMDGTHCDITCDGWQQGRFHCFPGRQWQPPLPSCTVPKERESCRCQNGGVCVDNGRCQCPGGWTGTYCEKLARQRAACPDPGIPRDGSRLNPDGTDASFPRNFEEGDSVIFTCNGEGVALQGSSFITCRADGSWSASRPRCVRTAAPTSYCPDPGYIQSGSRTNADGSNTRRSSRYASGQSVVYNCQEGYELVGSNILTCLPSGFWSSDRPTCRRTRSTARDPSPEKSCRRPGVDVNGVIEDHPLLDPQRRGQKFPPGTELKFSCKAGYESEGATILFCQRSGEWSSPPPTCKVATTTEKTTPPEVCKHPGVDVNGKIEDEPLDPRERRRVFPVDTALTFSCNAGYEPEGETIIYCLNNGEWTSVPPSCRRTVSEPSELTQLCRLPRIDPNIEVEEFFSLDPRKIQGFEPGQELTFKCRNGYDLEGPKMTKCLPNGRWSSSLPRCNPKSRNQNDNRPVSECPAPEIDPNGFVEEFLLDPRKLTQSFERGAELTFRCRDGYVLEGWSTIRCSGNGRWSSPSPRCHVKSNSDPITPSPTRCLNPGHISNGRMFVFRPPGDLSQPSANEDDFDFPFGTHLKYTCNDGFFLEGDESMSCESNSYWSGSVPMCLEGRN